ncbi:hypothetical protein CDIK_0225 [Cucumispora dikerogammari]|nr:hypothetical protein CDIK_0225 [Cucumispora dikerogammari]
MGIRDEFDKLEMSTSSEEIPDSIDKSSYRALRKLQKGEKNEFKETKSIINFPTEKEFNNSESLNSHIIEDFLKSSDIRCFIGLASFFNNKMFNKELYLDTLYGQLALNIKTNRKMGLKYSQLIYLSTEYFRDPKILYLIKNKHYLSIIIQESENRYKKECEALKNISIQK